MEEYAEGAISRPTLDQSGGWVAYPSRGGERKAHRGTCPTLVLYLFKRNTPQIKVSPYFNQGRGVPEIQKISKIRICFGKDAKHPRRYGI